MPERGSRLGRYRLLARLGSGGMAEVFLARIEGPAGFKKTVAIKRMRPELTKNREFVDLFVDEARTAAMLSHPNICHIHELTCVGGQYFIVMEYLEGVPLSSVMRQAMRHPTLLDHRFVVGIFAQACEGLHHAHEMVDEVGRPLEIIHRDISPPNLFVTTDGVVKVLDFGISKSRNSLVRTLTGQVRGKFSYMSPEQLSGTPLDRRSDIFSLGIVMFELVTGRRLFRRPERMSIIDAIVKDPIPSARRFRGDLPDELAAVIDRALSRDRRKRYTTARELGGALADAVESLGGPSTTAEIGALVRGHFAADLESKPGLTTELHDHAPEDVPRAVDAPMTFDVSMTADEPWSGDYPLAPQGEATVPDARADTQRDPTDTSAHALPPDTHIDLSPAPAAAEELEDDGPIPPPSNPDRDL